MAGPKAGNVLVLLRGESKTSTEEALILVIHVWAGCHPNLGLITFELAHTLDTLTQSLKLSLRTKDFFNLSV